MRVLLVGAYPPPIGGVAIHIKQLGARCLAEGWDVRIVDLYGGGGVARDDPSHVVRLAGIMPLRLHRLRTLLRGFDGDLVHFHVSGMGRFGPVAGRLMQAARPAHTLLTLHSGRFPRTRSMLSWSRGLTERIAVKACSNADHIVAVSNVQAEFLTSRELPVERISVIPGFLGLEGREQAEVPALDRLDNDRTTIVSSGYGQRYYGFDVLIDALSGPDLRDRVNLVVVMYGSIDSSYRERIRAKLCGLSSTLFLQDLNAAEFHTVLSRSDIYVRATDRDGDSLAVREALACRVVTVASDCVFRPDGVHLFRSGSAAALTRVLQTIVDGEIAPVTTDIGNVEYWSPIRDLYVRLVSENTRTD